LQQGGTWYTSQSMNELVHGARSSCANWKNESITFVHDSFI